MSASNTPTVAVIDDTNVHYNTSRDAGQALAPSKAVSDSVSAAKASPWNGTLAIITSPISIWYNVTGYSRIAVYGALIPPSSIGVTAWANYTINGNYTAANITTSTHIVTDFPLFTSVELDPNQQYNLTADIWASPDAPYLFDYLLAFSPPNPTPVSTSSTATASSTSTGAPTATAQSSGDSIDIPHPIIIIGALAGGCALLLALWLATLCCWCRSRGSKPKNIDKEEPMGMGPEPPFAPRPTVSKSATLVSPKASRRGESFLEPPLQSSDSSTLASTPGLSLMLERAPTPVNVAPGPAPRPTTTYVPEHGQFAPGLPTHHRSATLPTTHYFASPVPSSMMPHEGIHQRPIVPQHMLPHAASMPRLGTPLGMSTPMALQLPTPFEHPPAGQILRAESPLHNPYDDLYGHLDRDAPVVTASGSSTPIGTRSLSPAPRPSAFPTSTPTPIPTPTPTTAPAPAAQYTTGGPPASTPSAPTTSAAASPSAPVQPEATTAAPAAPAAPASAAGKVKRLSPNKYPPEKQKQEVRLEPPAAQASASSPDKEDFGDSPPAYSS